MADTQQVAGVRLSPLTLPPKPAVTGTNPPPGQAPAVPTADSVGPSTTPTVAAAQKTLSESDKIIQKFDQIKSRDQGLKITGQAVATRLKKVVDEKQAAGAGERLNRYDVAYILGFIDEGDWNVRSSLKNNGRGADTSKMTEAAYNTFAGDYQNSGTIDSQGLREALTCYAKYNQGILGLNLSHFVELKTIREIDIGVLTSCLKEIAKDPDKLFLEFCRTQAEFLREFMMQTAREANNSSWENYKNMAPEDLAKDRDLLAVFNDPAKYEQLKTMSVVLFVRMSTDLDVNKIEPPKEKYLTDPLAKKLYVDTIFNTYLLKGMTDKKATESAVAEIEKFGGNIGKLRDYLASHGYSATQIAGNPSEIDNLLEGLSADQLEPVFILKGSEKGPALKLLQGDRITAGAQKSNAPRVDVKGA
jgi:hypothetical protein